MNSLLEKALTYLLNEEHEKAEEAFHQFMVARSKQIHESLRQGDDAVLDEKWEQEIAENYFTEDDLSDLEDDDKANGEGDDFGGEDTGDADKFDGDDDDDDFGADDAADDLSGDMDVDGAEGEGDLDDRFDSLEQQIENLTAAFEKLAHTEEDEHGEDFDGDGVIGDANGEDEEDMAADEDGDAMDDPDNMDNADEEMDDDDGDETGEDDEDKDEFDEDVDFDDITESIVSELEKVNCNLGEDGKEVGAGKKIAQNDTSPVPQRKIGDRAKNAKPVETGKGPEHNGYERETAPATKEMKKRENTRRNTNDGRTKVSKEGDKKALLNTFGSEEGNLASPIGSKGTVGNRGGLE